MKGPKKNTEKIDNLLNAFSALSESDIEEARAVIASAGKDPDEIIRKGLARISGIRENIIRKRASNPAAGKLACPVFVIAGNLLTLSASGEYNEDLLGLEDIYPILLNHQKEYQISDSAAGIKLIRFQKEFLFLIAIGPDQASVSALIGKRERIEFPLAAIGLMRHVGYYIHDSVCYPLDRDSLVFAVSLLGETDDNGNLPLNTALRYFSERQQNKWIEFTQTGFDIHQVLLSSSYSFESSLFIQELYDYQRDGLKWLMYCCINRLGGILADDMGLGKTAQIIALIAALTERKILEKILIIVPSTLLENWRREFIFFAPEIVPFIHHGNQRGGSVTEIAQQQVVITSYSMIINDQYLFNKIKWGLTVLDEASLIKNPDSERRTALNGITSEVNIAMTGTPVENSLLDLWSLADFVRRGYMGTRKDFTSKYIRKLGDPAQSEQDLSLLRDDVSHIMLRRKKEDVLDSLPERIDIHQALVMEPEESALYEQKRQSMIKSSENDTGIMLEMITELRIYTTHPFIRTFQQDQSVSVRELSGHSSKFKRTMELLGEISQAKEKVLIFTEFTRMTDMFTQSLSAHFGLEVFTVDGRVPVDQRQKNIDLFSAATGFAIMILNPRTAGMGLNITAANNVIHYTRQWNPALEEQASARAYRNGQRKGVNVYYLYYTGTVEEIIDSRLKAKQALSGEVIQVTETENIEDYLNALSITPKIK